MANPRYSLVAILVLVACAFTYTAIYTTLPVSVNPCAHTLPRTLLAVTGLDPYVVSCATADDDTSNSLLSDGGHDDKKSGRAGGPIVTDLLQCRKPDGPYLPENLQCCPPMPASEPVDFTLPDPSEPLRTRRPAHVAGAEYMAKYERAIALMKALPRSDPHSFYQQASIHCAYCTGAYRQVGHPELAVQIHYSWLFFPFHRAYIYFFERIAAKLLGDPGFALPFWSWDVPEGMRMPAAFANASSPLYDPVRNPRHAPPKLVDLDFDFDGPEKNYTDEQQIQHNLWTMYKQMIRSAPLPSLFHGQPFRAGEPDMPGAGTVELQPHNVMHIWALTMPLVVTRFSTHTMLTLIGYGMHGATLVVAIRGDTLISRTLTGSTPLFSSTTKRLGLCVSLFVTCSIPRSFVTPIIMSPPTTPNMKYGWNDELEESIRFPMSLDKMVTTKVLVVEHIETDDISRFDVFVDARKHKNIEPSGREMVGSFVCLRHHNMHNNNTRKGVKTTMRIALSKVLEDLGAERDESVTVTLMPRHGKVRIGGLRIEYKGE
uniref:Tyrosinase copper-binding domain-containing protein n=1 Tax=Leersia perrieri TaxID=77586 RepID=A0A0D9V6N1_9ORYZ